MLEDENLKLSQETFLKQRIRIESKSDSNSNKELEEFLENSKEDSYEEKKEKNDNFITIFFTNIVWFFMKNVSFFSLLTFATFWCSILIYLTFYYNFIPKLSYKREINFLYSENFKNPYAKFDLIDIYSPKIFTRGQKYDFFLNLNLPESDTNWNQGMFMIDFALADKDYKSIKTFKKSAILKFKSLLIRYMEKLVFAPFYLFNFYEEKQTLSIKILERYIDEIYFKAEKIYIQIEANNLQIYNSELVITASLSGLTYFMINWPLISSSIGVIIIFLFLFFIFTFTFYGLIFNTEENFEEKVENSFYENNSDSSNPDSTGIINLD